MDEIGMPRKECITTIVVNVAVSSDCEQVLATHVAETNQTQEAASISGKCTHTHKKTCPTLYATWRCTF